MSAFTTIAEFYEVLSDSNARLEREGPLLKQCLEQAPGKRVLDVACGTGLHAGFLAELDANVTAFDASPEMIEHAGDRRPHEKVTYAVCDMRDIEGGPWDLALCLGNSITLLDSLEDVRTTMAAVHASLAPGGLFVVQIINYAAESAQQPRHRIETKMVDEREIVAVKNLVPHADRTLLSLAFFCRQDGEYSSASETSVQMNLRREELEQAATEAGFQVKAIYGAFDRSEYVAAASPDVVLVLQH